MIDWYKYFRDLLFLVIIIGNGVKRWIWCGFSFEVSLYSIVKRDRKENGYCDWGYKERVVDFFIGKGW